MDDLDREVLFSNEAFVISMLQGVSGGSIVAAISQFTNLVENAGRISLLIFVTAMATGLALAVLAGYLKHQYKLWDVKARCSIAEAKMYHSQGAIQDAKNAETTATERGNKTARYLSGMRFFMAFSVIGVLFGIGYLVFALWTFPSQVS